MNLPKTITVLHNAQIFGRMVRVLCIGSVFIDESSTIDTTIQFVLEGEEDIKMSVSDRDMYEIKLKMTQTFVKEERPFGQPRIFAAPKTGLAILGF